MAVLTIFIVLPILGAVIGYTTKWTSVQLIFKPSRFVGVGPIGWQGVVQRRSPKFAAGVAGTLRQVLPLDELLGRVDSDELAAVVADAFGSRLDELIPIVVDEIAPGTWAKAPEHVRDTLRTVLGQELLSAIAEVITVARPTVAAQLDVDSLVVELLSGENADRLARLIQAIGAQELRTIIRYGAVVGFFVGAIEAVTYLVFDRWWLLPAIGAADGLVNNWMGIQMIFRPLERRRYFGLFPYQGLFPKRQAQIAHDYARMMATEVLTADALAKHINNSATGDELLRIARAVLRRRLEPQLQLVGPALGIESSPALIDSVADAALGAALGDGLDPDQFTDVISHVEERLQIEATIEERLASMDKLEFEKILRGIFEEDEALLVGIGGVIGGLIGCLQAAIVLGLNLGR
jgi:uncharacterized membrane protein YheB (UPF0754 family)